MTTIDFTSRGTSGIPTDQRARTNMITSTTPITSKPATAVRKQHRLAGLLLAAAAIVAPAAAGCGPDFDPPSLIEKTRVLGARVEVNGAPDRASPLPGETATVSWLITAPGSAPALGWAFALCKPDAGGLGCAGEPLAVYQGTENPPRLTMVVPVAAVLGDAKFLALYGRICDGAMPTFDPQSGYPGCTDGASGTTAAVTVRVQSGADANHNPTMDRSLQFDGQPWAPPVAGSDPCVTGPRVPVSKDDHVIDMLTLGTDRETFTTLMGDPPVATAGRESLQISQFTTVGELKSPYSFVEAVDASAMTTVTAKWKTPAVGKVTVETPVTFTFVMRDGRGGIDSTTRTACVVP